MRLILRVLSAIVITITVALALLTFIPGQKLAEIAGKQIQKQTGREILFGGEVRYSLWPVVGVRADDVTLANADWAGPEPLLTAGRLFIGLDAAALLGGEVRVTEVSAIVPRINLETDADGRGNWEFASAAGASDTPAAVSETGTALFVEALNLSGASVRYKAAGEPVVEFNQMDVSVDWPQPTDAVRINLTLRPEGAPVVVVGQIMDPTAVLAGRETELDLDVTALGTALKVVGRADMTGAFQGHVTGESEDTAAFLAALGVEGVAIPDGLGRAGAFAADVSYAPGETLSLSGLSAVLDGNQIAGEVDLQLTAPPTLEANLTAGVLNLQALDATTGAEAAGADAVSEAGWSDERIDASVLSLLNGKIRLAAEGIRTSQVTLDQSEVMLVIDNARAVLSLLPVNAYGGQIVGDLVVNSRGGMSVRSDIEFSQITLENALHDLADYDQLTGRADGTLKLLGVGDSLAQIMGSLTGSGKLEVGRGRYVGFDLQKIMNPKGGDGGSTIFESLSASYQVEQGMLRNDDLKAALKLLSAQGQGLVDLGKRSLDYTFTPSISTGDDGGILSVPVRLSGAWDDPDIRPDLSKIVEPQVDQVETQAKEVLREKLSEELGAEVETIEDVNEALKRRVEEQARKQLLQFLGGD